METQSRRPNCVKLGLVDWNPLACRLVNIQVLFHLAKYSHLFQSYDPIFVFPIPDSLPEPPALSRSSTPIIHTPGRRTGTGSAKISAPSSTAVSRIPVHRFQQFSLLSMINLAGRAPPFQNTKPGSLGISLEEIRRAASKPVVVFPECTTSNGRGLLRFAEVFRQNVPVKNCQVFIMSVRWVSMLKLKYISLNLTLADTTHRPRLLPRWRTRYRPILWILSFTSFCFQPPCHLLRFPSVNLRHQSHLVPRCSSLVTFFPTILEMISSQKPARFWSPKWLNSKGRAWDGKIRATFWNFTEGKISDTCNARFYSRNDWYWPCLQWVLNLFVFFGKW